MELWLIADSSSVMSTLWIIFKVAAGLGLVIFVHELGHFVAAKSCGVKCEKFYIGFDIPIKIGPIALPSTLCKFRWGETEYGVGILPLGGYVKMLGQDDNPKRQAEENERIKVRKQETESAEQPDIATSVDSASDRPEASSDGEAKADKDTGDQDEEFELDPRSYPARPVWQRMIIISAGVIMNMVFAIVFAAIAYRMGVSYTPCIVGGTAPGSPAWTCALNPGDEFLQIDRDGKLDEQLRFYKDLLPDIMLNDRDNTMEFLIRRRGESSAEWISMRPTDRIKGGGTKRATVGVRPPDTAKLSQGRPVDRHRFDDEVYERLKGGDEIIAAGGERLPRNEQTGEIPAHYLEAVLAQTMTESLTLTVLRRSRDAEANGGEASTEEFDVTLPPAKMRVVGLSMTMGPIVAVRKGTPADQAGFQAGDVLTSIAGEDVGNPITLSQRLLGMVGKQIEVGVKRKGADEPVILQVTPQLPSAFEDRFGPGSVVSLEALGVAFPLENKVQAVEPDTPAAEKKLQPGDEIVRVQFVLTDEKKKEEVEELLGSTYNEELELSKDEKNWHYVHSALQVSVPGMVLKVTYQRDGAEHEATLAPAESDEWFLADRGLNLAQLSEVRTAESWGEAMRLGVRETKETLTQVLIVLKRLVTGKIAVTQLGGPIKIAAVAGAEASEGIPRLLIFLTFLSANLAVLNFLPIPALDGGHMVFLAAEGIRGKPVDERLQITLTLIGVGCLLSLMVFVIAMDIDWLTKL